MEQKHKIIGATVGVCSLILFVTLFAMHSNLESNFYQLESQFMDIEEKQNTLHETTEDLPKTTDVKALRDNMKRSPNETNHLEILIRELQEKVNENHKAMAQQKADLTAQMKHQMKDDLSILTKEVNEAKEDVSQMQENISHLKDTLKSSENERNELEGQLDKLNATFFTNSQMKTEATTGNYEQEIAKLKNELNMLKANLTNNQMEDESTPKNYEQQEVEQLKREVNMLKETQNNLKEAVVVGGAHDCKQLLDMGFNDDGIYNIRTSDGKSFKTWCDMTNGGWIIMQHRYDGSTNFTRNFQEFADGFGDLNHEYWLGLENVHQLTKAGKWELKVEMETYQENRIFASYSDFKIGQSPGYRLNVGDFNANSTAMDSLTDIHHGALFTTYDRDQDVDDQFNLANSYDGAWWYAPFATSNLNAFVYGDDTSLAYSQRMFWINAGEDKLDENKLSEYFRVMKKTWMKIRPQ